MKATNKIVLYFIIMLIKQKSELQSTCLSSIDEIIEIVRFDNVIEV